MKNAGSPECERNKARSSVINSIVPESLGLPQPGGGSPVPSIGSATHIRPSKLAYRIPQWV